MTIAGIPTDVVRNSDFTWASLANKPLVFPPSAHSHPISDLTGLGTGVAAALASAVSGSGGLVGATNPTLTTPTIGGTLNLTGTGLSAYANRLTLDSNNYWRNDGALQCTSFLVASGSNGPFITTTEIKLGPTHTIGFNGTGGPVSYPNTITMGREADGVMGFYTDSTKATKGSIACASVRLPFDAWSIRAGGVDKMWFGSDNTTYYKAYTHTFRNWLDQTQCVIDVTGCIRPNQVLVSGVGSVGSGDRYTIYHTDTTYNRSVGFFHSENGAEGGLKSTSQLHMKPGGSFSIYPTGQTTISATMAVVASEFQWTTYNSPLIYLPSAASIVPMRCRGLSGQTGNLFECQTNTPTTVFSVSNAGAVTAASTITAPFFSTSGAYIFSGGTNFSGNGNGGVNIRNGANTVLVSTDSSGNAIFSGTLGFSQSRFQQPSAQVLQTQVYDTTLLAWQETERSQASPSGAKWSIFGATPILKQTLPAAATDAATTQSLCNAIRSLLVNFGFSN